MCPPLIWAMIQCRDSYSIYTVSLEFFLIERSIAWMLLLKRMILNIECSLCVFFYSTEKKKTSRLWSCEVFRSCFEFTLQGLEFKPVKNIFSSCDSPHLQGWRSSYVKVWILLKSSAYLKVQNEGSFFCNWCNMTSRLNLQLTFSSIIKLKDQDSVLIHTSGPLEEPPEPPKTIVPWIDFHNYGVESECETTEQAGV